MCMVFAEHVSVYYVYAWCLKVVLDYLDLLLQTALRYQVDANSFESAAEDHKSRKHLDSRPLIIFFNDPKLHLFLKSIF